MNQPQPANFDNLRVLRLLGSGSYANTYLVEDLAGGKLAVKWLRADSEAFGPQRFENERWALERLSPLNLTPYPPDQLSVFIGVHRWLILLCRFQPILLSIIIWPPMNADEHGSGSRLSIA